MKRHFIQHLLISTSLLATSIGAFAHGYMTEPTSRAYLCKIGGNNQCGAVQWEPQSIEAPSGFPAQGPADGKIASAGHIQFSELDAQTSDRWTKRDIKAGPQNMSWFFTANHTTRNWRYYITQQDWNPNQPLTRAAFDLKPFCEVDGGMQKPNPQTSHLCTVPQRTGYQVILGVWEVGDTVNSFYNVVDVMFDGNGGQPAPNWRQGGSIHPSVDLKSGDRVMTRVFDQNGERPQLQTALTIANSTQGQRNNWAHALASKINQEQQHIRAGQKASNGQFGPVYGLNPIYLKTSSGLSRVEIQIEQKQPPLVHRVQVSNLAREYRIQDGKVTLTFNVAAQGDLNVSNTVYNHGGVAQGQSEASLNNSNQTFTMALSNVKAGHHQLVVKGTPKNGGTYVQQTLDMMFNDATAGGQYDFVFPASIKSYQAGTLVKQNKDGKTYRCKPFPYSGYCSQWSNSATQYEPGVGSHWASAWDEVK
ncbi:N-acetylglucosamine-binding protein GbpA [Deefgea sp. CFH1-16]|uniref:N-acetylglucosamine-binding protein GbpA n=1 Tax=Deefgea sp. CFH1-16 TaxID=2675457 RepID=UPI0015F559A8|nr:N-acetylglucosamine-binding protein GbpA [Deefgea sp. CFH1-16]MBM5573049.1 N-acetylglucosamine-binding protein GbpA [Deefgea sp. CFH1-16]